MRPPSIAMGEIAVARENGILRTLLGSCLGLALYDRRRKLAGLAHIVLPAAPGPGEKPGKYADTAIPAMIGRMQELSAGAPLKLQAKIAGGANMFAAADSGNTIGTQNIAAVERILETLRIPVTGRHCGGEQGRRMTLDTATGVVTIDIVGLESTTI
ncbi:MAG: chemotaxis protein CheD [Planctomycetaceae bacterium]